MHAAWQESAVMSAQWALDHMDAQVRAEASLKTVVSKEFSMPKCIYTNKRYRPVSFITSVLSVAVVCMLTAYTFGVVGGKGTL